jgi:lambda family phage minor tail protein L
VTIANDSQKLVIDSPYVVLFQLDATKLGSQVFYFTQAVLNNAPVTWQGNVYYPIDIAATGFAQDGQGTLPRPKLQIGNATQAIAAAVISFSNLEGAIVTRFRTLKKYLDGQPNADPTAYWPADVYEIQQKTGHNKFYIEWQLASLMDCQGQKLPGRQIIRGWCSQIYRRWNGTAFDYTEATCPYTGTGYWDALGKSCAASADQCGKKDSDCRLRFLAPAVLPRIAFPGVSRVKVS